MSYDSAVLADSPVTYYKMDDLSGTTCTDSSGNGNHGTYTDTCTLGGSGAFASSTNSVQLGAAFSATGKIAVTGFAPGTGAFSVEGWVQILANLSGSSSALNYIYEQTGSVWEFRFEIDGGFYFGTPTFRMLYGGGADGGHYEPFPNDNAWHHVVLTYSGSGTLKFYIDGALVNTTSHSGWNFNAAVNSFIGGSAASDLFRGSVDNYAFYHSALSAARVSAHYVTALGAFSGGGSDTAGVTDVGGGTTSTTITNMLVSDSFNRADTSSTLGSTDNYFGGSLGPQAWVPDQGTWGIGGNVAYASALSSFQAKAVIDVGKSNVDTQFMIYYLPTGGGGLIFRYTDSNNFWMIERVFNIFVTSDKLFKMVSGTLTQVGSDVPVSGAFGDILRARAVGNDITIYRNGTQILSTTDSFNATATKHGMFSSSAGTNGFLANDYQLADVRSAYVETVGTSDAITSASTLHIPRPVTDTPGISDALGIVANSSSYRVTKPDYCKDPSYSPDGTKILFTERIGSEYRISTVNVAGGGHTVLTTGSQPYADPLYSADGAYILYTQQTGAVSGPHPYGQWSLYFMDAAGTNVVEILNDGNANMHACWITSTQVAFQTWNYASTPSSAFTISLIDLAGLNRSDLGEGEYPRGVTV